jgi:2-C-methyl-D-erythritol 4-phosphate cytidylyltransferase
MGGVRKPFLRIADEPVLLHALRPFLTEPRVVRIAVALPQDLVLAPPPWLAELDERIVLVAGGATRSESVGLAIRALDDDVTVIAVHDAARPLVTSETIGRCIDVAETGSGAVAGSPAVDTIKRVDDGLRIVDTPDRALLWSAHTPQVFPAAVLRRAYEAAGLATDDSALVEALGEAVVMVDDGDWNIKVTRPDDVVVAEALLAGRTRV